MNVNNIAKTAGGLATALLLLVSMSATPLQAAGTPVIGAGGIVNAASNRPPDQPGGDIAQGSMFSIYGVEMGPAAPGVGVTVFPLANNLAGVEITVTQGGTTVNAIPIFAFAGQINAIMPSNAPLGEVQVRVICNGVASEPETVTVVQTSIGIFTRPGSSAGSITNFVSAVEQPLNTSTNPATPNQTVILWVTGVSGIDGPDNIPPGTVKGASPGLRDFKDEIGLEVFVGGVPVALIRYAGRSFEFAALDQIIVDLAANVALGCNTPVYMVARGITSNTVTMATSADGGECTDEVGNPITDNLGTGKNGSIALARVKANADLEALGLLLPAPIEKALGLAKGITFPPIGNTVTTTLDVGVASFVEVTETEMIDPDLLNTITSFIEMPPYGTCASFNTENLPDLPDTGTGGGEARPLGAGSPITLTRTSGGGTRTLALQNGTAAAILGEGGFQPLSLFLGITSPQLFLDGGSYRAEAGAGAEIGAWSVDFDLPPPQSIGRMTVHSVWSAATPTRSSRGPAETTRSSLKWSS